jgi:hypothetical protein
MTSVNGYLPAFGLALKNYITLNIQSFLFLLKSLIRLSDRQRIRKAGHLFAARLISYLKEGTFLDETQMREMINATNCIPSFSFASERETTNNL